MRRPTNWISLAIAVPCLSANLMIAGCGGGADAEVGADVMPADSGMLRRVRSAAELEQSLKTSLPQVLDLGQTHPPFTATTTGENSFSTTYTAEAGVDEFDYVRYDGTYLYVAPTPGTSTQAPRAIRILRTDPVSGTATEVSSISVEGKQQVQGLFVANGRLVMVTSEVNYGTYGQAWNTLFVWEPTALQLQVFNVNDPLHPTKMLQADIDGAFVATRRVGDRVYLVSRHSPFVRGVALLASMSLDDLLPKVTVAGATRPLLAPSDCYITNAADTRGYPVLTTITSFSMQNPAVLASTCYGEKTDGVYASSTALYLSQQRSSSTAPGTFTRIHKFAFTGAAQTYAGSVEIPGEIWLGGQRDFRMSEYQGMLRVMTTEQTADPADAQDHRLFVLRPKADGVALEVVSSLPNSAHPEEIGKPNEGLYGVRFIGDRAYAITFRQTDPLYVLDLATPADPRIAGTLEIPGFSEFLHPVSHDLLLGLGREANGMKLELFDVSLLAQPQSRGRIVFDGQASDSEAIYDRHAFTYLPADTADRFAIPATVLPRAQPGVPLQARSSLHQFEIRSKQNAASASLQAVGVVTPPVTNDNDRFVSSSRAFIHGDALYYVRDGKVWATSWLTPSLVQGPF